MDQLLFAKLTSLLPLDPSTRPAVACKLCRGDAYFFDVVDFNKSCAPEFYAFGASGIPVSYFRCSACGFIFTKFFDDWTLQDFAQFIYNADYIKVDGEYAGVRPRREAEAMAKRLAGLSHLKILDYGSGSGLFADRLQALGFDGVVSYDPFSSPNRPQGRFDVVTCFEVLEHTTSPRDTMSDVVSFLDSTGCVIFSTGIQPPTIGDIRANWWYVAPRNGHVSIYSLNALAQLGQPFGLVLNAGAGGTAFAGGSISPASQQILELVGRPMQFYRLTAPGRGDEIPAEQATSWHSVEGTGAAAFRWTREPCIDWRLRAQPLEPCDLFIEIPVQNEIVSGFANSCQVEVGGHRSPLIRDVGVLKVTIPIRDRVAAIVKLVMPQLLRPCDIGRINDTRALGLAINTTAFTSSKSI